MFYKSTGVSVLHPVDELNKLLSSAEGDGVDLLAADGFERVRQANREAQERYNRIQAMFTDDEAYVFREANNVCWKRMPSISRSGVAN